MWNKTVLVGAVDFLWWVVEKYTPRFIIACPMNVRSVWWSCQWRPWERSAFKHRLRVHNQVCSECGSMWMYGDPQGFSQETCDVKLFLWVLQLFNHGQWRCINVCVSLPLNAKWLNIWAGFCVHLLFSAYGGGATNSWAHVLYMGPWYSCLLWNGNLDICEYDITSQLQCWASGGRGTKTLCDVLYKSYSFYDADGRSSSA